MTIINVNPGFFYELTKLPSEVIALILGLLPKCMLPELLYFPPIKEIVISTIFSNVSITYQTERHRGNDGAEAGYWECDCHEFCFTLVDLLEGIKNGIYIQDPFIYAIWMDFKTNRIPSLNF